MEIIIGGMAIQIPEDTVQSLELMIPELPSDLMHSLKTRPSVYKYALLLLAIHEEFGNDGLSQIREVLEQERDRRKACAKNLQHSRLSRTVVDEWYIAEVE